VRRFQTATQTADLVFALGSDTFGSFGVDDIEVLPGNPAAVAVARKKSGSPRHAGVAIYDNGVKRQAETPGHTGSNLIEFSDSASTLYGFNTETSERGFRTMSVTANGVAVTHTLPSALNGNVVEMDFGGGRIYTTFGEIFDPVTRTVLGTLPVTNAVAVVADPVLGRTFFLTYSNLSMGTGTAAVVAFDQRTLFQVGSLTIPGVQGGPTQTSVRSLIRWGTDGLAFRTGTEVIVFRIPETWLTPASVSFNLRDRSSKSVLSDGGATSTQRGYARIRPEPGKSTVSGIAIYGYRPENYLVSETGVPAVRPTTSGRFYVEMGGSVSTAIALVNPGPNFAQISFFYTDTAGTVVGSSQTGLGPGGQHAVSLDAPPYNTFPGPAFQGTFSFTSTAPVGAMAMRTFINERADPLASSLPVIDTSQPADFTTAVLPHFAFGGGWTTQILLVNPTDTPILGNLEFRDNNGALVSVPIGGQSATTFPYSIPGRSSRKLVSTGAGLPLTSTAVQVVPQGGTARPAALVLFSYRPLNITFSEATVPVISALTSRLYVESSKSTQPALNVQSAIAVANKTAASVGVNFELIHVDGTSTGLFASVTLPPNGRLSQFLDEIFTSGLPDPFQGILRISSTAEVSVIGIRSRYNENRDFLVTTTPPVNEADPAASVDLLLPMLVDGGGYKTQFILFSGTPLQNGLGNLQFLNVVGLPWTLNVK
jgi:hypothetical protein